MIKSLIKNVRDVGSIKDKGYIILNRKGRVMTDRLYDDAYFAHVVKELVKQLPNDSQLGSEIRSLYYKATQE